MTKPLFLLTVLTTVFALAFSGCKKGENPLKPYETDDHPIVWNYSTNIHNTNADIIPAMDADGNIYFALQESSSSNKTIVFAINRTGDELWKKEIDGTIGSQLIYQDESLFLAVTIIDELSYETTTTYCISSTNGTIIWQRETRQRGGCVMAVSDDFVITAGRNQGEPSGEEEDFEINILDKSGNLIQLIGTNLGVRAVSIIDHKFYYACQHSGGSGYGQIRLEKYDLLTHTFDWVYFGSELVEENWNIASPDLVVDNDNNIYLVTQFQLDIYLHIVSPEGNLIHKTKLDEANDVTLTPTIDMEGNFYMGAPGFIRKYSTDANQIWQFDDYNHTTATGPNLGFGPLLSTDGMIYYGGTDGFYAVKDTPEISWIIYPETGFNYPGYPNLNSDGNIIVVSDNYVSCIKGDGKQMLNSAWPKVYQNIGNTSSR